jgi:hypothetical protein
LMLAKSVYVFLLAILLFLHERHSLVSSNLVKY